MTFPIDTSFIGKGAIFVGKRDVYKYEGNDKTDTIESRAFELVLPTQNYQKIAVKIADPRFANFGDNLKDSTEPVFCTLSNLTCAPYLGRTGRVELSFRADSITVISGGK